MKNYNVVKIFLLIVGVFMSSLSSAKGEECEWGISGNMNNYDNGTYNALVITQNCYTDSSKSHEISYSGTTIKIPRSDASVSFETGEPIITYKGQTYDLNSAPKRWGYTYVFDTEKESNKAIVLQEDRINYNTDGSYEINSKIYNNDILQDYGWQTYGKLLATYKDNYNSSGQLISKYVDGSLIESYQYNADGTYTTYDANGNELGRFNADGSEYIKPKRTSYTIQEANEATPNADGKYSVRLSF